MNLSVIPNPGPYEIDLGIAQVDLTDFMGQLVTDADRFVSRQLTKVEKAARRATDRIAKAAYITTAGLIVGVALVVFLTRRKKR